jgi:hypothetical protein
VARFPARPANHDRQHRLRFELRSRKIKGKVLDQWQYEVTGSGHIWYCPDPESMTVHVTHAGTGHPKATD